MDPSWREDYERDGFVVIDEVLSSEEVDELLAETAAIARGRRGPVRGIEPADDTMSDDDVLGRYLAIHFPHKVSNTIRDRWLSHPRFVEILRACVGPNIKCMQSMLFVKPAGKPGQAWHQDENFIPTRDRSLCGLWIALDDATIENGCMWARPGSHTSGIIHRTAPHDQPGEFDEGHALIGTPDDDDDGVPLEVSAGGVVLFHGYLHHRSLRNRGAPGTYRRALVNHYMRAESLLPWDWDGRLAPTRDMRDIVMIAGEDPYAHHGIDDVTFGFLRAETGSEDDPNRDPLKQTF